MQERFQNQFSEHQLHEQLEQARRENPHGTFAELTAGWGVNRKTKETEAALEPRHLTLVKPLVEVQTVAEPKPVREDSEQPELSRSSQRS